MSRAWWHSTRRCVEACRGLEPPELAYVAAPIARLALEEATYLSFLAQIEGERSGDGRRFLDALEHDAIRRMHGTLQRVGEQVSPDDDRPFASRLKDLLPMTQNLAEFGQAGSIEQVSERLRNPGDLYAMCRVLSMFSHAGPLTAVAEILERFGFGSPRTPATRAMLVGVTVSSGVQASQALNHLLGTHVMWELERIAGRMDLQPLFLAPPQGRVRQHPGMASAAHLLSRGVPLRQRGLFVLLQAPRLSHLRRHALPGQADDGDFL